MKDFKPNFSKCFGVFLQQSLISLILLWQMLKVFFRAVFHMFFFFFFFSDPLFDLLSTGGGVVCCQIPGVQMALLLIGKG